MKKLLIALLLLCILPGTTACSSQASSAIGDAAQEIDDQTVNIIKPTVTFVTNGGSEVKSQKTNVVKEAPSTKREHYLFDGWYLDKDFKALAVFPLSVEYDTTLYAKWLKIYDERKSDQGLVISGKQGYSSLRSLDVSPMGFDLNALAEKNYLLKITVTYDISYSKKYDVLFDVGYAGAPHYEVYLMGEDLKGNFYEDVTAPKSERTETIVLCTAADYYNNNIISLSFHSNNVQNVIYVENITVTYSCGKDAAS